MDSELGRERAEWEDRVYCGSSEDMGQVPGESVGLAFTSPPYNVGKAYESRRPVPLDEYLGLLERVGSEVYRVLEPGGRYVVNVANLWRKPYVPLDAWLWGVHERLGFLPMGAVIWVKAKAAAGNCAWGSWRSAKAPVLRDVHETLLVFGKGSYGRVRKGQSDISAEEFCQATTSVWEIRPESARRVGHPCPFPVALAERVIRLWSFVDDVVLDPFAGSGTTCVAAKGLGRRFLGYDVMAEYVALAEKRLAGVRVAGVAA